MNVALGSAAIGWATLALMVGLGVLIYGFRQYFRRLGRKTSLTSQPLTVENRNKHPAVNVFRWSNTFLRVGMIASLTFVVLAFSYTTYEVTEFEIGPMEAEDIIDNDPPRTIDPPKPPPPPPPPPVIEEVNVEEVEEEPEFVDNFIDEEEEVLPPPPPPKIEKPVVAPPPPPDPVDDTPIRFAEQMPRFPGCQNFSGDRKAKDLCAQRALMKFLSSKLNYPALARENGIEGTAVIRFVVEKDGHLSKLEIVKDPGGGLGKEALRVVDLMNSMEENWSPGKQNGRSVRVQFNLPIRFNLQ
ncbi:MAG: energy transducer TonB [Bacteroidota bacterium]